MQRKDPIIIDSIFHVFNKTIEAKQVFDKEINCNKFLDALIFYRSSALKMRLSRYDKFTSKLKDVYKIKLEDSDRFRVNILAYCLMPTHFHLLLKQRLTDGVSTFLSNIQNSFTRFFNIKNSRIGPIFVQSYKSVLIRSEQQLKHISRYIHLNPYSGNIVNTEEDLFSYPWSSFSEYLGNSRVKISEPNFIMNMFGNSYERYRKFVFDNANYQRTLEYCKDSITFKV